MVPYVAPFVVSTICVYFATRGSWGKILRIFFGALAVLVMSMFAGVRDIAVGGPDAMFYGSQIFSETARSGSFAEAYARAQVVGAKGEPAYVALNYIVSRFSDSLNWFFFALALLVNATVLVAVLLLGEYGPAWLMWLTYLCTLYVNTFNLLRQSEAIALTLLGISLLLVGKPVVSLLVGLCGVLFHTSAAFFVPVYLISLVVLRRAGKRRVGAVWLILVVFIVVGVSVVGIDVLGSGLLADEYGSYLDGSGESSSLGFDFLYRLVPLAAGLAVVFGRDKWTASGSNEAVVATGSLAVGRGRSSFARVGEAASDPALWAPRWYSASAALFCVLAAELVLFPIRAANPTLSRLVMYFTAPRIFAYAGFALRIGISRLVALLGAVAFVIVYFYGIFVVTGVAEYSSVIAPWLGA